MTTVGSRWKRASCRTIRTTENPSPSASRVATASRSGTSRSSSSCTASASGLRTTRMLRFLQHARDPASPLGVAVEQQDGGGRRAGARQGPGVARQVFRPSGRPGRPHRRRRRPRAAGPPPEASRSAPRRGAGWIAGWSRSRRRRRGRPRPGPVPITSRSGRLPAETASGSSFRVRRSTAYPAATRPSVELVAIRARRQDQHGAQPGFGQVGRGAEPGAGDRQQRLQPPDGVLQLGRILRHRLREDQALSRPRDLADLGEPVRSPGPGQPWKPVRSAGSTCAPLRNASISARSSANIRGSSSRYSRWSSRYASSKLSLMGSRNRSKARRAPATNDGAVLQCPRTSVPFRAASTALRSSTTRITGIPGQPSPSVVTSSTAANPRSTGSGRAQSARGTPAA